MRYLAFLVLLCNLPLCGVAEEVTAEQLKQQFVGSVVALRSPLRGSEIVFKPTGEPVPPVLHGSFGRDGILRIEEVRLDGPNLKIEARREMLVAEDVSAPLEVDQTNEKTRLTIVLPSRDKDDVDKILDAIFRQRAEMQRTIGHYANGLKAGESIETPEISLANCRLTPLSKPASDAFLSGRYVAKLIVNQFGEPDAIALVRPPKSNSDLKSLVSMLWNWRFPPVRRNGRPALCTAAIGVTFRRGR